MPNSKTHTQLTTGILVPTLVVGGYFLVSASQPEIFLAAVGITTTLAINPDLDLVENRRRWNLWNLYWFPYGKLMHHRSKWSHGIIVSTFIRFIYIGWPLLFLDINPYFFIWIFVGMVMSDSLHTIADKISTWVKTRSRKH